MKVKMNGKEKDQYTRTLNAEVNQLRFDLSQANYDKKAFMVIAAIEAALLVVMAISVIL